MKSWIRRTLLGVFGASIALGALTACGHHRGHGGWGGNTAEDRARQQEWVVERVTRRLDLSPAQQAKLRALAATLQAEREAFAGQPHPREQMRVLVAGDKFDRAQAQVLAEKASDALRARSPAVIAAFGDFYDSLDPGQQVKVREFMERRRGWRHRG
jgi:protein CpxP